MFAEIVQDAFNAGGILGGIASVVFSVVTAVLSYKANRDRLEFDREKDKLHDRVNWLEDELADAKQQLSDARDAEGRCWDRYRQLEQELRDTRARLDQLYSHLADRGISPPPAPTEGDQ